METATAALRAARAELEERFAPKSRRASSSSSFSTQALLVLLVVVNANDQVLKEFSRAQRDFPYQVSSVVLAASALSVLGGTAAACMSWGFAQGLRRCLDPRQIRLCCLPSVLFTYSTVLRFFALHFVGADVLAVMEPTFGLALSAFAAWALKGRTFQRRQVAALAAAMLGLCWFLALRGTALCAASAQTLPSPQGLAGGVADSPRSSTMLALGWLCVFGGAALGTLAGLAGERFLKRGSSANPTAWGSEPLLVQKTQLEVPAFFAALFSSIFLEPLWDPGIEELPLERARVGGGLFRGWDAWTLAVLLAVLARSWLATGVVKHLDTLRYSLAQVLAMLLTFLELELLSAHSAREAEGLGEGLLLPAVRSRLSTYAAMALVAVSIGAFSLSQPLAPVKAASALGADGSEGGLADPLLGRRRRIRLRAPWADAFRQTRRACASAALSCVKKCPRCLRRLRRRGRDVALVIGYVAADTGKMLLVGWANHGRPAAESFLPSSLLLVQLIVSVAIALFLAGAKMGQEGLWLAVRPANVLRCAPVATFFFVSKTCTVAALEQVDAGTVKLSTQLILPCSALLSVCLITGRSYSGEQWVSIATICLGTLAFHAVQIEADRTSALPCDELEHLRQARAAGMLLCGAVVLANSFGSVVGERLLKGEKCTPLACLKARLVLAELFIVVVVLAGVEAPTRGGRWFAGWSWRVLVCALGWVPATWMSTLITARFSTVVKNLVQCLSTLVTYFLALLDPNHMGHSLPATLLAFVVMLSVSSFTLQSAAASAAAEQPSSSANSRRRTSSDLSASVPRSNSDVSSISSPEESAQAAAEASEEPAVLRRRLGSEDQQLPVSMVSVLDLVTYGSEPEWKRCASEPQRLCEMGFEFLENEEDIFFRGHTL